VTRLTIIIPARDEADRLGAVLTRLASTPELQVVVVDGQSVDRTSEIARDAGAVVIPSPPGRGRQMNAGAEVADGEVLLFLHADTLLPDDFTEHVHMVLARPGVVAGAFELRIDAPHRSLRVVERLVRWRSRRRQMPYGDQAIFMRAETFREVGGFPPLPVMEDYEMMRRLRRLGRIGMAPAAVLTSARRWLACGIWRTTLQNQLCVVAYHLGVPPERIARWRGLRPSATPLRSPFPVTMRRT
jgi:rSAM/selenodomain-associated transferase 2